MSQEEASGASRNAKSRRFLGIEGTILEESSRTPKGKGSSGCPLPKALRCSNGRR